MKKLNKIWLNAELLPTVFDCILFEPQLIQIASLCFLVLKGIIRMETEYGSFRIKVSYFLHLQEVSFMTSSQICTSKSCSLLVFVSCLTMKIWSFNAYLTGG